MKPSYEPGPLEDLEQLVQLRIEAMRESLKLPVHVGADESPRQSFLRAARLRSPEPDRVRRLLPTRPAHVRAPLFMNVRAPDRQLRTACES